MAGATRTAVAVRALSKVYAERNVHVKAVDGVSFEVPEGAFYTLLGPSGCGKTTTMRCIAGLERVDGGSIAIAGTTVSSETVFVPPDKRGIGMVFQSYAIWPHMTVFQNAVFPLKAAGANPKAPETIAKVEEALALVRLDGYASRMATQLSGGQQQRLALARAIVGQPKLLLLDEPLSNLDARLRDQMREELRALQRRLGVTTIYVTHDQTEALSMSDRIAVMDAGRLVQEGTPDEMYLRPATPFVAEFLGSSNLIDASVIGTDGAAGRYLLETPLGRVTVESARAYAAGERVTLGVRAEAVKLGPPGDGGAAARIVSIAFLGELTECVVEAGATRVRCRMLSPVRLAVGDAVSVHAPEQAGIVAGG